MKRYLESWTWVLLVVAGLGLLGGLTMIADANQATEPYEQHCGASGILQVQLDGKVLQDESSPPVCKP